MADKKISEMTAASAYTGANEFYEIVQGGATRQGSNALLKTYFDTLYPAKSAVANIARVEKNTASRYNTVIPYDDTIPQSSEGSEIFTVTHTPVSASNYIRVRAVINVKQDVATVVFLTAALFKDSGADAVQATGFYPGVGNDYLCQLIIDYRVLAGSTSAATWKIRVGAGSAQNFTVNGANNARLYGGVQVSSLTVSEEPG